jgi:hypothetical protein
MTARGRTRVEVTAWMVAAVLLTLMYQMMLWCPDDETIRGQDRPSTCGGCR